MDKEEARERLKKKEQEKFEAMSEDEKKEYLKYQRKLDALKKKLREIKDKYRE